MGLWAAFVWSLGSDGMASQETSRIIGPIVDWLLPDLSWQERRSLLYGIRKGAHVFEYGTLALLSLRALWLSWHHSMLLTSVFSAGARTGCCAASIGTPALRSQNAMKPRCASSLCR